MTARPYVLLFACLVGCSGVSPAASALAIAFVALTFAVWRLVSDEREASARRQVLLHVAMRGMTSSERIKSDLTELADRRIDIALTQLAGRLLVRKIGRPGDAGQWFESTRAGDRSAAADQARNEIGRP